MQNKPSGLAAAGNIHSSYFQSWFLNNFRVNTSCSAWRLTKNCRFISFPFIETFTRFEKIFQVFFPEQAYNNEQRHKYNVWHKVYCKDDKSDKIKRIEKVLQWDCISSEDGLVICQIFRGSSIFHRCANIFPVAPLGVDRSKLSIDYFVCWCLFLAPDVPVKNIWDDQSNSSFQQPWETTVIEILPIFCK